MAAKDAEMPAHHALAEEVEAIAKHLRTLRKDIEDLGGTVARAGGHQAERAQDAMMEAVAAIEDAAKRNPLSTVGIALGVGFLVGIILRR
ncbi:MAG: DUF883 C-terminal domain-containing protein [Methyloceanibacter sp.]|jgi:ElaB/YqjD/DUF883 family membrane-anchored ribosome-binding protein